MYVWEQRALFVYAVPVFGEASRHEVMFLIRCGSSYWFSLSK